MAKTQCKDEFRNLSGCVPEILTASRIDIIFFLNTIRKLLSIAFQPCISLGGVHMVEMGQKNDFVQILGLKTQISADTFLDHLTLEGARTPNFKSTDIFHMFPEILGA